MTWLWVTIAVLTAGSAALDAVAWRNLRRTRQLRDVAPTIAENPPRVSVVMAARNEADRVGAAISARLADRYPDLELVLVDDRSTDGTGEIARAAAQGDPRLQVVRVDSLPDGWLGKVHALAEGVRHASGDYLLFSDADVMVAPETTARAIALCEAEDVDCLALVPEYRSSSVLVDATWTVFVRGMCLAIDSRRISEPKSKTVVGSGAFTLVRREALERTAGFEHLRMETGDDMALAAMVKAAGGRCAGAFGADCVQVRMYDSAGAFLRGIEKNGSTTAANAAAFCAGIAAFAIVDLMPLVAVLAGPIVATPARGSRRGPGLGCQHRDPQGDVPDVGARAAVAGRNRPVRARHDPRDAPRQGARRGLVARDLLPARGPRGRPPIHAVACVLRRRTLVPRTVAAVRRGLGRIRWTRRFRESATRARRTAR